jgi:hypothetical protein
MVSLTDLHLIDKSVPSVRGLCEQLLEYVGQASSSPIALMTMERSVLAQVLRIGHAAIELILQNQGNGDLGESIVAPDQHVLHRSPAPQSRQLRTIFGEHQFSQYTYSAGQHHKIALRPVDARLELSPRMYSYLLEEFSQMFCVESAFAQSARNLSTVFGGKFSVDTLESCTTQMGQQAETFLDDLPLPAPADEGELLVASADGKGVPLIREDAPKVKAFETQKLRPGNRRMATLGAVYSVDRFPRTAEEIVGALFRDPQEGLHAVRPPIRFKHVAAHFAEVYPDGDSTITSTGPIEACGWLGSQVDRRLKAEQPLILLVDGDHRLWSTAREFLPEKTIEILDILHVSTYIWSAAKVFCTSEKERERFTRVRLQLILEGRVMSVVSGLRRMATSRKLRGEQWSTIARNCNYLASHRARMQYHEYLREGYPIATGVIEGACRHLVKDRMERSGMRWTLVGAKAMLNVRAVFQSQYWREFHDQRMADELKTNHPLRQLLQNYRPEQALAC